MAFIEANGNIHEGPAEQDFFGQRQSIGSDSTCADIRAAIEDSSIQAIVFRVDSGGGSYTASDGVYSSLSLSLSLSLSPILVLHLLSDSTSAGIGQPCLCRHLTAPSN